jgi:hypothetical protein
MSRSKKKAVIKDRPRNIKKSSFYWRQVRSTQNNAIKSCRDFEELEIPSAKTIVNDYDYCDYKIDYEFDLYVSVNNTLENAKKDQTKNRRK